MNADMKRILKRTDPEHREAYGRVPGACFQVARKTVDDPTQREKGA